MSEFFTSVRCLECGHEMPADLMLSQCAACDSEWLDASYDYASVAKVWEAAISQRQETLWRYQELFPIEGANPKISMGEGRTPLIRLYPYEDLYEHPGIYIKDERQGPTNSFKDRQAMFAVTAIQRHGVREVAMASAGNAGVAYAAYCARVHIKLWLFYSSSVPAEKMREAALYGAEVIKVSGSYDEAKKVASTFAKRRGIHLERGAKFIPSKESMKTIAFEIAEQLGLQRHPDGSQKWVAPDWYIQAVSGGIGPLGVWKGFKELHLMGLIDKMPRLGIVQVEGCAPMVQAFKAGKATADPVVPNTLITVLATGDPGLSYVQLREAVNSNGGTMISVSDGDTFKSMRNLARRGGFSVEPAAAVAFAGMEHMLTEGTIKPGESVVVNCSGHTMPVDSSILEGEYILNLELDRLTSGESISTTFEEGLGTALKHLDERITSILLVDDNARDRRLVRRLLQRYKHYRIFEAEDGHEGFLMAQDRLPDLIVADLTMPEMDGFALLEKLKSRPDTANIPVVVLSAKALTEKDNEFLAEHSKSVWTKGSFATTELADHVVELLGDAPIEIVRPTRKPSNRPPRKTQAQAGSKKHTVLIIDDNQSDIRLTRRLLESSGDYQVIEALTGENGLEKAREEHPDLILLDLMVPNMDGFEVLKRLQEDDSLASIPVIVVSAKELTIEERQQLREGVRSLIQKSSLDSKPFLATVEQTLSHDESL